MAKFVDLIVDFLSYEAASSTSSPVDAVKIKSQVSESSVQEVYRIQQRVATATVDQAIALPSASAEYLLIFCDQTISAKINGSTTAIPLIPQTAGTKCAVFFNKGTITSLSVSNASGSTVNLDIIAINK